MSKRISFSRYVMNDIRRLINAVEDVATEIRKLRDVLENDLQTQTVPVDKQE